MTRAASVRAGATAETRLPCMQKWLVCRDAEFRERHRVAGQRVHTRPAFLPWLRWHVYRGSCSLKRLAEASQYGEEEVRFVGCGLLLLTCISTAFAGEGYIEICNLPEALGGTHQGKSASKSSQPRRRPSHGMIQRCTTATSLTRTRGSTSGTHDEMSDGPPARSRGTSISAMA